jgi:hypothetical protein
MTQTFYPPDPNPKFGLCPTQRAIRLCGLNQLLTPLPFQPSCRFHPSAVRWCLTVPAGLSQQSMSVMRKAAMAAGLIPSADSPSLIITSEPEAAALTAQQRKHLPGQDLVAGVSGELSMLGRCTRCSCGDCLQETVCGDCLPSGLVPAAFTPPGAPT